jgi:hypothetical protein
VARTANALLTENREQIQLSLDELQAALAAAKSVSETADARLPATLDRMDSAMTSVTTLATELRGLTAKMQSEDGTIGKLIASDEIYIRLNSTLAQVDSLAKDIRTKGLRNRIVLF